MRIEKKGVQRGCFSGLDAFLWGGAVMMVCVAALAAVGLTSVRVSADETQTALASVTVSSSCQLASTIDSAHQADVTASTYRPDIGKTTFTATCNDANGYDVYAVGYTNTEFGRTDMLGAESGRTIDTGTATSGATSNWAMKLTAVAGEVEPTIATGYDAYHAIPDDYTKVASYASSTMDEELGSQFETTYAVYTASTQSADTYTGRVRYTLVHPSDAENRPCVGNYTIIYNANGGTGTMDSQTACVDKAISVLPSGFTPSVPVAENQFAVWNTEADGSGYTYTARQAVTNLASSGGSVTLYAQWAPKYIQDLTANTCSVVAKENPLTVYDRRDGNTYTVRWLQGACWMTQNLRIKGVVSKQYSNFTTNESVNVCEGDLTAGRTLDQPRCHDSGNTSDGVWYNYAAVSARTILSNNSRDTSTEDICPTGWHVPSYDTGASAGSINSMAGVTAPIRNAFTPSSGGYYAGNSLYYKNYGFWWSSTGIDPTWCLKSGSGVLEIVNSAWQYLGRTEGLSLRCVRTAE